MSTKYHPLFNLRINRTYLLREKLPDIINSQEHPTK